MRITELQNETNHLLFLYFTSIGVIQRDAESSEVQNSINELVKEIEGCMKRIMEYVDEKEEKEEELCDDYIETISSGNEFVRDGVYFLDKILKTRF